MNATEHFVFALVEDFSHIAFACAIEPLRIANLVSGEELYRWSLASENGQTAKGSSGIEVRVDRGFDPLPEGSRLFVLSGIHAKRHVTPALLSFVRRERSRGRPIGALCSGAYVLAKAGLLDGVRTSIHWEYHDAFLEEFPDVALCRSVFVADDKYITAAGGAATADLMLHLIAEAHGSQLSSVVADQMLFSVVRESDSRQTASIPYRVGARSPHLIKAIDLMTKSIEEPRAMSSIAQEIGITTRHLERLFGRHFHCSPTKYFVDLRLQKARNLLAHTDLSITEIALASGFRSNSHFSRMYKTHFGDSPSTQRARFG